MLRFEDHLDHLHRIRSAALEAADPARAVRAHLGLSASGLHVGGKRFPLLPDGRVYLVAFGKASLSMARAAVVVLGDRLTAGLVVIPHGTLQPHLPRLEFIEAGHPLPDEGSLEGGRRAAELARRAGDHDYLLALVSGGGSAMLELAAEGVSLQDLRETQNILLRSGLPIAEINLVRRALSRLKGGGLARLAAPARTLGLVLSDVIGDRLSAIASGPTVLVPPASPWDQGLGALLPPSTRAALGRPRRAARSRPTPRPHNRIIAGNRTALEAAQREAARIGFSAVILSRRMQGEAGLAGSRLAHRVRRSPGSPTAYLLGGETTVTVRGPGSGGRNQELALSAALALEDVPHVALLALATDGIDGPTDAAGAIVTGETAARIRALGRDPKADLEANDSYKPLALAHTLVRTGPSGTNVGDIVVVVRYP
ncbi:MAG: DUF4147 domain-containing protein [Anaerolineales bacterium]